MTQARTASTVEEKDTIFVYLKKRKKITIEGNEDGKFCGQTLIEVPKSTIFTMAFVSGCGWWLVLTGLNGDLKQDWSGMIVPKLTRNWS